MANSNNKQSSGVLSTAFGVAKKLSTTGLDLMNHVAPGSIAPLEQRPEHHSVIHIHDNEKTMNEKVTDKKHSENPQQLLRAHVPKVTQQLLGRHYSKVNNVASLISPNLNNKIADFFFNKLNDLVSDSSSVEHVLKEVGAKELTELSQDASRSDRIAQALANQNKTLAAVQGAITGASGVVGTAIDIPLSLALTLRTIYQSGRAHGFELNRSKEQEIVEYVFKEVDLGSIAEKQTLLIALRTLSNVLQTQDTRQLQTMLGSSNDFDKIRQWLSNEDGTLKWTWLNHIPQISVLSKLTPLAGAGIGAVYSWKLVDEASIKAQHIFSHAQQYLLQHPEEKLDVLSAFEKGVAQAQAQGVLSAPAQQDSKPLDSKPSDSKPSDSKLSDSKLSDSKPSDSKQETVDESSKAVDEPSIEPQHPVEVELENDAVSAVRIEHKSDAQKEAPVSIEEGIKKLAEQHVEPHGDNADTEKSDSNEAKSDQDNLQQNKSDQSKANASKNQASPNETSSKGEAKVDTKTAAPKVVVKKKAATQEQSQPETSSITKKPQS